MQCYPYKGTKCNTSNGSDHHTTTMYSRTSSPDTTEHRRTFFFWRNQGQQYSPSDINSPATVPKLSGICQSWQQMAGNHQPDLALEDAVVLEVVVELLVLPVSQLKAISAASSFALLRFLPSYQKRAVKTFPCTSTWLDQAVLPPDVVLVVSQDLVCCVDMENKPRRSETIWNFGGISCATRHASVQSQAMFFAIKGA